MTWRPVQGGLEVLDDDGMAVALVATPAEAMRLIRDIERE